MRLLPESEENIMEQLFPIRIGFMICFILCFLLVFSYSWGSIIGCLIGLSVGGFLLWHVSGAFALMLWCMSPGEEIK